MEGFSTVHPIIDNRVLFMVNCTGTVTPFSTNQIAGSNGKNER